MGYDGKGQFLIDEVSQIDEIWQEIEAKKILDKGLILEKFCPFLSEISVLVAKNENNEIIPYEPLTNIHKNGILDKSIYPAQISRKIQQKSQEISVKIAQKLDLIGILAIEFFVMNDEILFVNEMAPRPHNSGHFSMDGSFTCQFEQLIRAISNKKLGNVDYFAKGHMQNLIGQEVNDLSEFENDKNAKIHLYSKKEVKKGRKMGHVNIISTK